MAPECSLETAGGDMAEISGVDLVQIAEADLVERILV